MIVVMFNQKEADFLLDEFGIKVDSELRFAFTKEKAAEIQDICLDIEHEEHAVENGNIKRGRTAEDTYYTMLAAWPKGEHFVDYLKKPLLAESNAS